MKITEVRTHYLTGGWRPWIMVKVLTDDGIFGWGEVTVEGKEKAVIAAVGELARYLEGQDPFRIEQHWPRDVSRRFLGGRADPDFGDQRYRPGSLGHQGQGARRAGV